MIRLDTMAAAMESEIERLANELALSEFFFNLDNDFHDIQKTTDDTFAYNATGVQVQNTWELPIVVQWPNSTIKFRFSTRPGDIHFGIAFVPALEEGQTKDDMKVEMIEELGLVSSGHEEIEGQFTLNCEGVIIMMWDNNYDWTAIKKLSYIVEVNEPSFQTIDTERSDHALKILREVTDESRVLEQRLLDTDDFVKNFSVEMPAREEEIINLQTELETKVAEYRELQKIINGLSAVIEVNTRRKAGLGIRMLNEYLLSQVFSYLNPDGAINLVCTYWRGIAAKLRGSVVIQDCLKSENELLLTMSKPERASLIAELKLSRSNKKETVDNTGVHYAHETADEAMQEVAFNHPISSQDDPILNSAKREMSRLLKKKGDQVGVVDVNLYSIDVTEPNTPAARSKIPEPDDVILKDNLKKAQVEHRIAMAITNLHQNCNKLSLLELEKRKLKKQLRAWNAQFEADNGRAPTNFERKEFVGQMYEDYHKISLTLRVRQDKVDDMLRRLHLSKDEFEDIRRNRNSTWGGFSRIIEEA